ncbi:MAG: FAD-dependent oxidoreductase [Gammaproteobacteria bacterium]|jgi:3-oxosteroid 1-dehydrogenase|nr:FAD-dependent oxidoreductase [Gammaproteobacteria bacterium]MBT7371024.1 FAD-dependent oxidoreductase [Gammaproteobacteria bacterium]
MADNDIDDTNRRRLLKGAGLLAGGAAIGSTALSASAEKTDDIRWDHAADVVCVGSGAAACSAAISAMVEGASVLLIEKMPVPGGTTARSGGVVWIPNNALMRASGVEDKKEDCMRYMARFAHSQNYSADSPNLGLSESDYGLLESFYDNGSKMVDLIQEVGAVTFQEFRMWALDKPGLDYADHLPENKVPTGRAIEPAVSTKSAEGGATLAQRLEHYLRKKNVPILVSHRVKDIIKQGNRVVGVVTEHEGKLVNIKAHRAVIFGTGGYAHNTELLSRHQDSLAYGACASPAATGDFISIATRAGAKLGTMHTAWRTEVLLEQALDNRVLPGGTFYLPGDSMIVVNKYGHRVVNEKRNYNDRTRIHFAYNPTREEYSNQLLFMIFDERSLDAFGGNFPIPEDRRESPWLISADTLEELSGEISQRLEKVASKTGGVELDESFGKQTKASIKAFNKYAKAGKDPEFDRGLHGYDREWHLLFSAMRKDTEQPVNPMPNRTMHPFTRKGPFYAFILAPGVLDTNGGPMINENAQILDTENQPIEGLYGAGNCIASPTRAAYYGAGGTIGPALTFGYIAGTHAARDSVSG